MKTFPQLLEEYETGNASQCNSGITPKLFDFIRKRYPFSDVENGEVKQEETACLGPQGQEL